MKIAKLNQLARQDALFHDKEPEVRYKRRQVVMVSDGYDFESNNATDTSSVTKWLKSYERFLLSRNKVIEYATSMVGTWSSGTQSDKDLILEFASLTELPTLTAAQKTDLESLVEPGFSIFEIGTNVKKYWNGSNWI